MRSAGAATCRCNWLETLQPVELPISLRVKSASLKVGDHASESVKADLLVSPRFISGNAICVSLSVSLYSFMVIMMGRGRDFCFLSP